MKKFILPLFLVIFSCQYEEIPINNTNTKQENINPTTKPVPSAKPSVSESNKPIDIEKEDIDPNDKEVVTTDTEVQETNIDWKIYNPINKGKKYTYNYNIKGKDTNLNTEILREIIEVTDKNYKLRQTIVSSSKDSQLRATETVIGINKNNAPSVIPVVSVSGEKINTNVKVEIKELPEIVKVPFKEIVAIKVTVNIDNSETINWYGKDIGLIKSIQNKDGITYTMELKDFS